MKARTSPTSKRRQRLAATGLEPRFYTVAEVAQLLTVATDKVYVLIEAGYLTAVRCGVGPRAPFRVTRASFDKSFPSRT